MPKKKSKRQGANRDAGKSSEPRKRHKQEVCESEEENSLAEEPVEFSLVSPALYKRDLYWGSKDRPTHFLAVRLTDRALLTSIQEIHQQILDLEPTYAECLIPVERLHITLGNIKLAESQGPQIHSEFDADSLNSSRTTSGIYGVNCNFEGATLNTNNQDQTSLNLEQATEILHRLGDELSVSASKLSIKLCGFNEFFNSTLYSKVADEDGLLRNWAEGLCERLRKNGIMLAEVFDFNPHVTLLKITRSIAFKLRTRYIDGRILPMLEGKNIAGEQRLCQSGIHLCEKSSKFREDGFYITPAYISLER